MCFQVHTNSPLQTALLQLFLRPCFLANCTSNLGSDGCDENTAWFQRRIIATVMEHTSFQNLSLQRVSNVSGWCSPMCLLLRAIHTRKAPEANQRTHRIECRDESADVRNKCGKAQDDNLH
jgi:hypothetical protein